MMMPANYSVIAENELTYVNGGANAIIDAIGAVTAPIWDLNNVKTFSTNVVTLIGNTYLNKVVGQTLGVLFSGNTTWDAVGKIPSNLFTTNVAGNAIEKNNFGDYVANALGVAAAVYNMGTTTVKNSVNNELTIAGK